MLTIVLTVLTYAAIYVGTDTPAIDIVVRCTKAALVHSIAVIAYCSLFGLISLLTRRDTRRRHHLRRGRRRAVCQLAVRNSPGHGHLLHAVDRLPHDGFRRDIFPRQRRQHCSHRLAVRRRARSEAARAPKHSRLPIGASNQQPRLHDRRSLALLPARIPRQGARRQLVIHRRWRSARLLGVSAVFI